jgi:signal transduction histidine kinase
VIWFVDPRHDNLTDLVYRMRAVANDLLNGVQWTFHAPDPVPQRRLRMILVRNAFLIYKEALNNAVRHGRATLVTIELREQASRLTLRVEDDGIGFDEAAVRAGHGLDSMRRRAAETGGHLAIEKAGGGGTRITFSAEMA